MSPIRLSTLLNHVDETLQQRFAGEFFWITAEILDVRKQPDKRWCFLKFIEKQNKIVYAEIRGVFWSSAYQNIERFEHLTGQVFASGLEITCKVRLRFHQRYGLDLEVMEIDLSYAVGKAEIERQRTLDRLARENPTVIQLIDGQYISVNAKRALPLVIQRIALITAPNSDGQRDFLNEITQNSYGYAFKITQFLTQIQGDNASAQIIAQLQLIERSQHEFDAVVIVRGGGSETDFKPFEDYGLALCVAGFPIAVLTGIGHDRNTSIVDMMARQHKTPTKVASTVVDHNYDFEFELLELKSRLLTKARNRIDHAQSNLVHLRRTINAYNPETILKKGYAMIVKDNKIIVHPGLLSSGDVITSILKNEAIESVIHKKSENERKF